MVVKFAICFAPGSGGNFVYSILSHIQDNTEINFNEDGSAHQSANGGAKLSSHLYVDGRFFQIDTSQESAQQEIDLIVDNNNSRFLVGHFRNLAKLVEEGYVPVYVSFTDDDIREISKRLCRKRTLIEENYNRMRGADWPLWGEPIPDWIIEEIASLNNQMYYDWYFIKHEKAFAIDFAELTSYTWVEDICFKYNLSVKDSTYIKNKMKEYESLQ